MSAHPIIAPTTPGHNVAPSGAAHAAPAFASYGTLPTAGLGPPQPQRGYPIPSNHIGNNTNNSVLGSLFSTRPLPAGVSVADAEQGAREVLAAWVRRLKIG